MAGDLIREVRRATLTHMKADAELLAIVPKAQQWPSTVPANPTWPFTRFDAPRSLPLDGSCFAGAEVSFLLHGFAKDRIVSGQVVETAEDHASRLATAIKSALHNRRLPVADGTARIQTGLVQINQDGEEAGAYHAIIPCKARVLAT